MAGTDRTAADRVAFFAALAERPYEFDFYQALRRLETAVCATSPRLGRSLRPARRPRAPRAGALAGLRPRHTRRL